MLELTHAILLVEAALHSVCFFFKYILRELTHAILLVEAALPSVCFIFIFIFIFIFNILIEP